MEAQKSLILNQPSPPKKKTRRATVYFESFSEKQLKVLTWWRDGSPVADCRGIICDGAIRSGKTLIMSMSYIMWAMEKFDGQQFGLAGKTIASLRRNLVTPLIQVIRARGYKVREHRHDNKVMVYYKGKMNTFFLFGGRDESSQDLVQGFTSAGFFFDEVTLMPRTFVEQCRARCSVTGSKQFYNCNPASPYHWIKTEVLDKCEQMKYLHIHFNIYDNPSLSEDIIDQYENSFQGVFYSRFILGKWVIGDGVVYDNFNQNTMVFKAETVAQARYGKTYIACDYGTANATVFKKWRKSLSNVVEEGTYGEKQIRVDDWVCTDEYYYSGKDNRGKQKTDDEYVKDLRNFCRYECAVWDSDGEFSHYDWSRVVVILDPSALSFRTALRKRGFKVKRAKNSVINGIRTMAGLLNNGTMKYSDVCEETFKEFGSYVWDAKKSEVGEDVPVKQFDHCMDADRYMAYTILRKRLGMEVWK